MPTAGIKVLVLGRLFKLPYDLHLVSDVKGLMSAVATFNPDVILTSVFLPGALNNAAFEIRKRWIHVSENAKDEDVVAAVENCHAFNLWTEHQNAKANPLVSVYTGTYQTGDFLRDVYQSLREQSYQNWEWVVLDDASSDGTWNRLVEISEEDVRVRPFRNAKRSGKIGEVKDVTTKLARGEYLVELDHDDMLTDNAVAEVVQAFEANPDAGMVYSNFAAFYQDGSPQRYDDDFWRNRYRWTEYRGKKYLECLTPDIYGRFGPDFTQQYAFFLTVAPNHVRAFRASILRAIGGYNAGLPVADDFDLMARMFLRSKIVHIPKMLYLYRFLDRFANSTFTRNKSIQDHLALARARYAAEFKEFNNWRLSGFRPQESPRNAALLTIAIPALASRWKTSLQSLLDDLFAQAKGKPVEIMAMLDNRVQSLSEKRNSAIRDAKGRFIAFVDDDDRIAPDYVDALLGAIRGNTDADCVVFDVEVSGYDDAPKICRYDKDLPYGKDEAGYTRKPNHTMCWRREVAAKHVYHNRPGEDTDWAMRAVSSIRKQIRIPKTLYYYQHDPNATTQPGMEAVLKGPKRSYSVSDMSFVVPEGKETPLTEACLASIREFAPDAEIILVANGSAPSSAAVSLADKVVRLETNLKFAAACNRGVMEASRDLVVILNNDASLVDAETPKLLAEAIGTKGEIAAPYSNRAKPPQGDIPKDQVPKDDLYPEAVVGVCMVMRTDLYRKVGGFDSRLYTWEDDDLCRRAIMLGAKCVVVGGTYVEHERHVTIRARGEDVNAIMAENRKIFDRKHPKIRVVAIAKDEREAIEGFFRQFEPLTKDWCVLDTGSTDGTVEFAQKIGVNVESGSFEDFSQARNLALDRFGGNADWIVMLDPDERLDAHTIANLEETLFRTPHDILLAPLEAVDAAGNRRRFVSKPFVFRSRPEIRWAFKVHEKLIGSLQQGLVVNGMIEHVLPLHTAERRASSEGLYLRLLKEEPYFTNPYYKATILKKWPILDYDLVEDPRIEKIHVGPLITAVVPTYKRPELAKRAVTSALGQDYANLEVVVVGDACPNLKSEWWIGNSRVRVLNLPTNHGAGGAVPRNYGIMLAAGDLISYLDDDNRIEPNHISSLYATMRDAEAEFAMSSMSVEGKDLGFREPKRGSMDTSCVLHKKDLVRRHGWWKNRDEAGYGHDAEFFTRWVAAGEKWASTGKPTLIYNIETCAQREFLERLVAEAPRNA